MCGNALQGFCQKNFCSVRLLLLADGGSYCQTVLSADAVDIIWQPYPAEQIFHWMKYFDLMVALQEKSDHKSYRDLSSGHHEYLYRTGLEMFQ